MKSIKLYHAFFSTFIANIEQTLDIDIEVLNAIEAELVEFNVAAAEIGSLVPELAAFMISLDIDAEAVATITESNQFSILVLIMETLKMIEVEAEIVIATEGSD